MIIKEDLYKYARVSFLMRRGQVFEQLELFKKCLCIIYYQKYGDLYVMRNDKTVEFSFYFMPNLIDVSQKIEYIKEFGGAFKPYIEVNGEKVSLFDNVSPFSSSFIQLARNNINFLKGTMHDTKIIAEEITEHRHIKIRFAVPISWLELSRNSYLANFLVENDFRSSRLNFFSHYLMEYGFKPLIDYYQASSELVVDFVLPINYFSKPYMLLGINHVSIPFTKEFITQLCMDMTSLPDYDSDDGIYIHSFRDRNDQHCQFVVRFHSYEKSFNPKTDSVTKA